MQITFDTQGKTALQLTQKMCVSFDVSGLGKEELGDRYK